MIKDAFGEKLKIKDTVAFLRNKELIIGPITDVTGYKVTVTDESNGREYKLNSHKVTKFSGDWKIETKVEDD